MNISIKSGPGNHLICPGNVSGGPGHFEHFFPLLQLLAHMLIRGPQNALILEHGSVGVAVVVVGVAVVGVVLVGV